MLAVTGATGFVGRTLCATLHATGQAVRAIGRETDADVFGVGDIGPDTMWHDALVGVTCVIHLAARVHHMREHGSDAIGLYRRTNVEGTLRLAREAHSRGVRRIVFVSSIKVNGERTAPGHPFRANDPPRPLDPYGVSKWEAELGLWDIARNTGLEVVVVRPPLVYGSGVGANFRALVSLVERGVPLPLGGICNKRSLIAVENLVDLLLRCASHSAAPGGTFLCSDGEDPSTPDLLRSIGTASNKPVRLLPVPPWALRLAGRVVGQASAIRRLTESLQVDIGATRTTLDWQPPLRPSEAMARAAATGWRTLPA